VTLDEIIKKYNLDWYAIRNCGQIFCDPKTDDWDTEKIENYIDFCTDYAPIRAFLSRFKPLLAPISHGFGLRILRQPFHECVISFIISANNNIKRFSKIIEKIDFKNLEKYTEIDFKNLGCGYRAAYLVRAVKQISTMDFEELNKMPNDDLRKTLMTISGVGRKVADCVMLFSFHRLDVAPVDTWIKKAQDTGIDFSQYGKYAGVAQQYIFYYTQHLRKSL
jgi:N-glycosylase/DNA lyase